MKLLLTIFLLLILPLSAFAGFGSVIIQPPPEGGGIAPGSDASLNSLDVLLYVKSNSLTVGCSSTTPTSGTVNALKYESCGNEPVVVGLGSGSSASNICEWRDELSDRKAFMSSDGYLTCDGRIESKLYMRTPYIQPFTVAADLKLQLRNDSYEHAFWNTTAKVASIDSAGTFETAGHLTNDGSGTHYIGYDGSSVKRFKTIYGEEINASLTIKAHRFESQGLELSLRAANTYGIVLMEDSAGADRLRTSQSGSGADIDVALEFTGGTNSGTITWDDFEQGHFFSSNITAGVNLKATGRIDAGTFMLCDDGYYGDTTSDAALMPKGAVYPSQAIPATPASGHTIFTNSTGGLLSKVDSSGTVSELGGGGGSGSGTYDLEDTVSDSTGILQKGAVNFLHNFHHPTGGSAVPTGDNIFLGRDNGNFTMGSTASNTYDASRNVVIGTGNYQLNTVGYRNIILGDGNMINSSDNGDHNIAIGTANMMSAAGTNNNITIGEDCGGNLRGNQNFFAGQNVGETAGDSDGNIGIGYNVFHDLTKGDYNVAFGHSAMINITEGNSNVAIGPGAGYALAHADYNTFVGNDAGEYTNTGHANVSLGSSSLRSNTTGGYNTAIGVSALREKDSSGELNTALGYGAGRYTATGDLTIANNCLYVGETTKAGANNVINETVIGSQAIGAGSNTVTIGSSSVTDTHLAGTTHAAKGVETPTGYGMGIGTQPVLNNMLNIKEASGAAGLVPPANEMSMFLYSDGLIYLRANAGNSASVELGPTGVLQANFIRTNALGTKDGTATSLSFGFLDGTAGHAVITSDTTLDNKKYTVIVDASSNTVTLTLPAAPAAGQQYRFKIKDATNVITIARNGKTIDWAANDYTSFAANDSIIFVWCSAANTWTIH